MNNSSEGTKIWSRNLIPRQEREKWEHNPLESMHEGCEREGSKSSSKLQRRRVLARTRPISANRNRKGRYFTIASFPRIYSRRLWSCSCTGLTPRNNLDYIRKEALLAVGHAPHDQNLYLSVNSQPLAHLGLLSFSLQNFMPNLFHLRGFIFNSFSLFG